MASAHISSSSRKPSLIPQVWPVTFSRFPQPSGLPPSQPWALWAVTAWWWVCILHRPGSSMRAVSGSLLCSQQSQHGAKHKLGTLGLSVVWLGGQNGCEKEGRWGRGEKVAGPGRSDGISKWSKKEARGILGGGNSLSNERRQDGCNMFREQDVLRLPCSSRRDQDGRREAERRKEPGDRKLWTQDWTPDRYQAGPGEPWKTLEPGTLKS